MSKGVLAVLGAASVVGIYAAWREAKRSDAEQQAVIQPAGYVTGGSKAKLAAWEAAQPKRSAKDALIGWGVETLFGAIENGGWLDGLGGKKGPAPATSGGFVRDTAPGLAANTNTAPKGVKSLLDLIGGVEAPKGYDQVYGGIRGADKPPRPITSMTVGEVLDWQDSIDSKYMSEAAGRYQIMEDTLREQVRQGVVSVDQRFDAGTQDKIAVSLMNRRGLGKYQAGLIGPEDFAQNLSKEWASLPAITTDKAGRRASGQSYYAGDGLNKSHVKQSTILDYVKGLF
jgi:muramidase (phage lysozyme)